MSTCICSSVRQILSSEMALYGENLTKLWASSMHSVREGVAPLEGEVLDNEVQRLIGVFNVWDGDVADLEKRELLD